MKKELCKFVEQNLWKYVDRELSARRVSEISTHLKACESCRQAYEERSRQATMYRLAFMGAPFDDEFAQKFRETLDTELEANTGLPDSPGESRGFLRAFDRRRVAIGLALTGVVVALFALTWIRFSTLMGPQLENRQAAAPRLTGDEPGALSGAGLVSIGHFRRGGPERVPGEDSEGEALYAGRLYDQDESRTGAYVEFDDKSTMIFSAQNWSFSVSEESVRQADSRVEVHEGEVGVFVTPRTSGSFILVTPNAEVKVIGTAFNLRVERGVQGETTTAVAVTEGEVKVTDSLTDRVFLLRPESGLLLFPRTADPKALRGSGTSKPTPLDMPR